MSLLKDIERGAATQFGREFGRAAANQLLKGKNAIIVASKERYDGRILPSDSDLLRTIKETKRLEFVTQDKGNITRLIELTNKVSSLFKFEGNKTLVQLADFKELLRIYNEKYEHGNVLIDTTEGKQIEFLKTKREELLVASDDFNTQLKDFVIRKQHETEATKKNKKTAAILAFIFGGIGVEWFYLNFKKVGGLGILSILFCWTGIPAFVGIVHGIALLNMTEAKFDASYNPEYSFYQQFSF